ncbi:MAG TPA: type II toxin-antitoxin system antitoxin SocA domain-containing protein [Gemmataceae bacterium]|nr:type II toxin-antitoxin system antitoxin SocA domain-containing protein [Gemmataceae bacterium]
MPRAIDVARYLIGLGAAEDEPDLLSPLRLQKLLYYVQGWHLGAFGRVLFDEPMEAWKHGPVVKSVYRAFKDYGDGGIPPPAEVSPSSLSCRDSAFIESVWQEYKKYSASGLRGMTHSEPPWRKARGGLSESDPSTATIASEDLRDYFGEKAAKKMLPGISLEAAYAGYEQFQRGQGRPAKDVFARMRARHAV